MKNKAKALVVRAAGTNCNSETAKAFEMAGATAEQAHINELITGGKKLSDYHILAVPGGFSYGDDLGSGKIFANQLAIKLGWQLQEYVESKKLVIGICNGFQVLIKLGLLPAIESTFAQEATLTNNDSGKFEDRWVYLKAENDSIFTKGIKKLYLPVNHGEGKFVADSSVIEELNRHRLVKMKYADEKGSEKAPYPYNPNGSQLNIAGITNKQGNVFGMMPHPEKFVEKHTHPRWTREQLPDEGEGLRIFRNMVEHAEKELV
ncbi:MAG TPA: phosphoribosylformylglycinamidine synthase I [Candidatus Nanoarchaeia archaeon]|nr:phosphoribosylformylglycinamidine synthase I [Candidatus Nanoarchaeia archaeon]